MGIFGDKNKNINNEQESKVICNFCGRSQSEVNRLFSGKNNTYICDECAKLCNDILDDEKKPTPQKEEYNQEYIDAAGASSIYNFHDNLSIEEVAENFINSFSDKYVNIYKPMLMRSYDGNETGTIKNLTMEEKAALSINFGFPKIKTIMEIDNLRIIILEPQTVYFEELDFKLIDSIIKDPNDNSNKIYTTIITNGIPDTPSLQGEDRHMFFVSLLARHMIVLEYAKRGFSYNTGDIEYTNGITTLRLNPWSYSDLYATYCIICGCVGVIQNCIGRSPAIYSKLYKKSDDTECPDFLWNAMARVDGKLTDIPEEIVLRYIDERLNYSKFTPNK